MLVEGARTDVRLMDHLLNIYGISDNHEIISYNTNIYTLYREMFENADHDDMDILMVLRARESDPEKRKIFDEHYSDIILIFDLDPHAPDFSADIIKEMQEYFVESSDMGKLYLNYPMVEAFYHMKSIPDNEYDSRTASVSELRTYKTRVNAENRNHDYSKFAINKTECDIVINQNIHKGLMISNSEKDGSTPDLFSILSQQLKMIEKNSVMHVLCTCVFYVIDYNPKLVDERAPD